MKEPKDWIARDDLKENRTIPEIFNSIKRLTTSKNKVPSLNTFQKAFITHEGATLTTIKLLYLAKTNGNDPDFKKFNVTDWAIRKGKKNNISSQNDLDVYTKDEELKNFLSSIGVNSEQNKRIGLITAIDRDKFYKTRKYVIAKTEGTLTLCGPSLFKAFNTNINDESDEPIINTVIGTENLKELRIFVHDPFLYDEHQSIDWKNPKVFSPLSQIVEGLKGIFYISQNRKDITIKVYFAPLIGLDHIVLTDKHLIYRRTMLWDKDEKFRGTRFLFEKSGAEDSMFVKFKDYLDLLQNNSFETSSLNDYIPNYQLNSKETYTSHAKKLLVEYKQYFKKASEIITFHKLHRRQLVTMMHRTWNPVIASWTNEITWENKDTILAESSEKIKNIDDLKNPEILLNCPTQKVLIPYISATEQLLDRVIKRYDKNGFACIIPSLELGMPFNVQRLAGGFATGSLVVWKSGTPIVPIDATINICTSSYYKIKSDISKKFTKDEIAKLLAKAHQNGVGCSFDRSNHFLSLYKNDKNEFYLVLHSSDNQMKYSPHGLYPHKDSWFQNKIKILWSDDGSRYIRYLKDDDAIQFINLVHSLNKSNELNHNFYAQTLAEDSSLTGGNYHHYYMPTSMSIAIGTFLVDPNTIIPIFSNVNKDIILYRANNNWKIQLDGRPQVMMPHGWGQRMKNIEKIAVKCSNGRLGKLFIGEGNGFEIEDITESMRDVVEMRPFNNCNEFLEDGKNFIDSGGIEQILHPIATFDRLGPRIF